MKRMTALFTMIALLGGGLLAYGASWDYTYASGHQGKIQSTYYYTAYPYGWGLDGTVRSGGGSWVHFTVPHPNNGYSSATGSYQWANGMVYLQFNALSADVGVKTVDIYNGTTKVWTSGAVNWTGYQSRWIYLPSLVTMSRAVGISVYVSAGVEAMSHRMIFYQVGISPDSTAGYTSPAGAEAAPR